MNNIENFLHISSFLTGFSTLSLLLAEEYLRRLEQFPEFSELPKLITIFNEKCRNSKSKEALVRKHIMEDEKLRGLVKVIILLWYTGEIHSTKDKEGGHPEHYFQGLLWSAVHAHPPGLSGGYFGYWMYPPEN